MRHRVEHAQGREIRVFRRRDQPGHRHGGQGHHGAVSIYGLRSGARGFGDRHARKGGVGIFDVAEILIHPTIQLSLIEIAHHHQRRVVGAIVSVVESLHVAERRGVEVGDGADPRTFIGVGG